jgi:hypothetical protein
MPLRALSIVVVVTVIGCSKTERDGRELKVELPVVHVGHGKSATILVVAAEHLKRMLDDRIKWKTVSFDPAIYELSSIVCSDVPGEERSRLLAMPLELLYPLDRWSRCVVVNCGGCFGAEGQLWGVGVATPPSVDE